MIDKNLCASDVLQLLAHPCTPQQRSLSCLRRRTVRMLLLLTSSLFQDGHHHQLRPGSRSVVGRHRSHGRPGVQNIQIQVSSHILEQALYPACVFKRVPGIKGTKTTQ